MAESNQILPVALPLLVGLALIAIAFLVARHGWRHRHNRFVSLLYGISGIKSLSEGFAPVADSFADAAALFPDAQAWHVVGIVAALAMPPLLLLFVASFPRPTTWMLRRPYLGAFAFAPSVIVGYILLTSSNAEAQFQTILAYSLFTTLITAGALALLNLARKKSPDKIERQQAAYVMIGFLPSFIATWSITTLYFQYAYGMISGAAAQLVLDSVIGVLSPLFEILAAGLIAVAILKFNLLGVSPKFRLGVKSGLIAVMFISLFLITQLIENIVLEGQIFAFAGDYGSFLLSGATGIVLFKPMEMASNKVSNKLLPNVEEEHVNNSRAAEVYHAQCSYVLRDAQVTDKEMAFLHNLRDQLGLSEAQAHAIEQEVETLLKVDSPRTGHAPPAKAPAGPKKPRSRS